MKRFFAVFAALIIAAGLLSSCAGGGDWKGKMTKVETLAAEMQTLLVKYLAGEAVDEKRIEALETEIEKYGEELDKMYPSLSEADKKEFDARKDAVEKMIDSM
ncbi:MAG: hypothetical protein A2Y33_08070 [Spirochaetes bacterium GWF1_51_8]|nr:MAG: hypothetical protein A2Y33_08070 [Spirochaetes bacterium GWF1_51_8]